MKINDDHMYHGAALTQIAEHEQFTSINAVRTEGRLSRSAFRVNEDIGIYLKYATKRTGPDFVFTFTMAHKAELDRLRQLCGKVFIALVCVKDRYICCLSLAEFDHWIDKRHKELGHPEDTSTVLVHLRDGGGFRVNMNLPGKKKLYLAKPQIVARKRFPSALFE